MKQTDPIEECLDKIDYFANRIKEEREKLYILVDIKNKKQLGTTKVGRKEGGSKEVLPKGWNNE